MALCDQEKTFRQQRKENIRESMKKLLGPKNSEGLNSARDVSWKFFKRCYTLIIIYLGQFPQEFYPNTAILRLSVIPLVF